MLNNFIYDLRAFKYRCVQAYLYMQLVEAQKSTDEGEGKPCVKDEATTKAMILEIKTTIERNNNTYDEIVSLARVNPFIVPYFNSIGKIVKKNFKIGVGWIPSFLAVEVLRQFQEKGYQDFKHVDLLFLLSKYEEFENRKDSNLGIHYKCAAELVDSIGKVRAFRKKRK